MGLYASFDVCADMGFMEYTPEYGIIPDYSYGCEIFCQTFEEVSKSLCPVDTGYLRSTLSASYNDTFCECETNCEYAQYQEYGTWCMPAQPYFEEALQQAIGSAYGAWVEAQEEAMMEEMELIEMEQEAEAKNGRGGGRGNTAGALLFSAQVGLPMQLGLIGGLSFSPSWGGLLLGLALGSVFTLASEVIKTAFDFNDNGKDGTNFSHGLFIPDVIIT